MRTVHEPADGGRSEVGTLGRGEGGVRDPYSTSSGLGLQGGDWELNAGPVVITNVIIWRSI